MKVKDNKGITIVEIIIAIAILGIVLSIGYNLINKTITSTHEQKNIDKINSTKNLLSIYLKKDIQNCKDIIKVNYVDGYSYIIKNSNDTYTEYHVEISEVDSQYNSFNVNRIELDSERNNITNIKIVDNIKINNTDNTPFEIQREEPIVEKNTPYEDSDFKDLYNATYKVNVILDTQKDINNRYYNIEINSNRIRVTVD